VIATTHGQSSSPAETITATSVAGTARNMREIPRDEAAMAAL
jgi:hypothetical protein